jgi:hypothetical protein
MHHDSSSTNQPPLSKDDKQALREIIQWAELCSSLKTYASSGSTIALQIAFLFFCSALLTSDKTILEKGLMGDKGMAASLAASAGLAICAMLLGLAEPTIKQSLNSMGFSDAKKALTAINKPGQTAVISTITQFEHPPEPERKGSPARPGAGAKQD